MSVSTVKRLAIASAGVATLSLALSTPAHALGFTGAYAPANFTVTNSNSFTSGSLDSANAPASITLIGSDTDEATFGRTSYTTIATEQSTISFNWLYNTADPGGPSGISFYDRFGYIVNGVRTQLTVDTLGSSQTGSTSFNVLGGQTFGFYIQTEDNLGGAATATISNFNATPVPTPAAIPAVLMGMAGMGYKAWRKHKAPATKGAANS
jgi:hypothetical protein